MSEHTKNTQVPQCMQTDVKCRFFAQYWGQEICQTKGGKYAINEDCFPLGTKSYLELKPLSKITDEDALEVANIISRTIHDSISKELVTYYKEDILKDPEVFCFANFQTVDFLRSRGYALSFLEYSVEDLVSFGWARLCEEADFERLNLINH